MSNELLKEAGALLVEHVYNMTIAETIDAIRGKMKDRESTEFAQSFAGFSEEERLAVEAVVPKVAELALHNLLSLLEEEQESEGGLRLVLNRAEGMVDLAETSDGLAGELYGARGWMSLFGDVSGG